MLTQQPIIEQALRKQVKNKYARKQKRKQENLHYSDAI
jgi:hypothetical protein